VVVGLKTLGTSVYTLILALQLHFFQYISCLLPNSRAALVNLD